MTERVRVGVVGTSWWADRMHLPYMKSHPRADLVAVCGRNRGRAEEMAGKYGIPMVFTDHREMIEKAHLHALVIATPDDLHYPMVMDALEAGLHVLCEKPLALNVEQARAMYAKAEAVGVKHMVFYTYRWYPPHYRYMKQLIEDEYTGRCFQCNLRYLAGYGYAPGYIWRFDRRRATGLLGDLGSHMIDLARWLVGDVRWVSGHLGFYGEHPGPQGQTIEAANDAALLTLGFVNGAQGAIQVSAMALTGARVQEQHVVIHGQAGTLESDYELGGGATLRGIRQGEEQFRELAVPDELWGDVNRNLPLMGQMEEMAARQPVGDRLFVDAILDDLPVTPSFYDGLKAQEIIDAAAASDEKGYVVSL